MLSRIDDLESLVFFVRGVAPFVGPLCLAAVLDILGVTVRDCCWEVEAMRMEKESRRLVLEIDGFRVMGNGGLM
jgi:hypothetical protein